MFFCLGVAKNFYATTFVATNLTVVFMTVRARVTKEIVIIARSRWTNPASVANASGKFFARRRRPGFNTSPVNNPATNYRIAAYISVKRNVILEIALNVI